MSYWQGKRAVVTGGSAGVGRALAGALVKQGARVVIVARGRDALETAAAELREQGGDVLTVAADVTNPDGIRHMAEAVERTWGGLDLLCHCAGRSMRGNALTTTVAEYRDLWEINFLSAVQCVQAFADSLVKNQGHIVLIGSLASKVAPLYLGAYPTSKFPLAALAQQLRLELVDMGVSVLLVCPGPVAREAENKDLGRYVNRPVDIPAAAHQPGGGAKVRVVDPDWLAEKILQAAEQRRAELVVPGKARLLFAISQVLPHFGDWLLRKMTPE